LLPFNLACAGTGTVSDPEHWVSRARRDAGRPDAHSDLAPVLDALWLGDPRGLPLGDVRERAIEDGHTRRRFAEVGQRLREHGPLLGIAAARQQSEGAWTWTIAVAVFGRGPQSATVVVRLGHDGGEHLARLVVLEPHQRVPVNRFILPVAGTWDVLQGGTRPEDNQHHGHPEQDFALDLVVRDEHGHVRPLDEPNTASAHFAYGAVVRAPAPGTVVKVVSDQPDRAPGDPGTGGGNGVVIDHGFGEFGAMWHFAPESVGVQVGDAVTTGQPLGRVGNSGATTLPHLHWHLSTGDGDTPRNALPLVIDDLAVDGHARRRHLPRRDERIRGAVHHTRAPGREAHADDDSPAVWLDL